MCMVICFAMKEVVIEKDALCNLFIMKSVCNIPNPAVRYNLSDIY